MIDSEDVGSASNATDDGGVGVVSIPIGLFNPAANNGTSMALIAYSNTSGAPPPPPSVPAGTLLYLVTGSVSPVPAGSFVYSISSATSSVDSGHSQMIPLSLTTQVNGFFQATEFTPSTAGTIYTLTLTYTDTNTQQQYKGVISIKGI